MDTKERTLNGAEHKRKGSKVSSRTLPHPHTDTHKYIERQKKRTIFIYRKNEGQEGMEGEVSPPIDVRDVAEPTRQSFN